MVHATEHTEFSLKQIIPAQPGAYALFRQAAHDDVPEVTWREPVIAWGLWEERIIMQSSSGARVGEPRVRMEAGPLILDYGYLTPAVQSNSRSFVGVRVGGYAEGDDMDGWDDKAENEDPFFSRSK